MKDIEGVRIEFSPYYSCGERYLAVAIVRVGKSWEVWSIKPPTDHMPECAPTRPESIKALLEFTAEFGRPMEEDEVSPVFPHIREPYLVEMVAA